MTSLPKRYNNIVQRLLNGNGRESSTLEQLLVALREYDRFKVRCEEEKKSDGQS